MHSLIDAAFGRTRTIILLFLVILAFGTVSYMTIPKESSPDIPIPMVYVFVTLDGIARRTPNACWCGRWRPSFSRSRASRR